MSHPVNRRIKLHEPVLIKEVLAGFGLDNVAPLKSQDLLVYKPNEVYIDSTLGTGGHTAEIIKRGFFVLGIDADKVMVGVARNNLMKVLRFNSGLKACPADNFKNYFVLVNDNFRNLDKITRKLGISMVEGVLFDLGLSSYHLDYDQRGFSFKDPSAKLDMRLSPETQDVTASMILNSLSKYSLISLFETVLPRNTSMRLADKVLLYRKSKTIETVGDFIDVIGEANIQKRKSKNIGTIRESTLPFLALRIAVNSELENLDEALNKAFALLRVGGRLSVISFHSGEDRIVKKLFRSIKGSGAGIIITKKPITATDEEIMNNPRARSAKLRIIEKINNYEKY